MVKAADSKSAGFIPRRFKSCCCRKIHILLSLLQPFTPPPLRFAPPFSSFSSQSTSSSSTYPFANNYYEFFSHLNTQSTLHTIINIQHNTTQHKRKHTHTSPNLPQDNPQINTHNVHNTYNIDTHSGPQHQTTNNPHMCHNKQSTTATTTASPYPSVTSSTLPYNSHTRLR